MRPPANFEIGQLMRVLLDASEFVSEQSLARTLDVSPERISDWIQKLREEGVALEAEPGRHVRLQRAPDLLFQQLIQVSLQTRLLGKRIHHYFQIHSTNDVAQQLAREGEPEGTLVVAEEQTQGRGRLGRSWFSEEAVGIYLSVVLRPRIMPSHAPVLNLAAAVAVTRAIEEVCGLIADIKWPNDVLVTGKKCCGVLAEMNAQQERVESLIVGIGINVNHRSIPDHLRATACSLFLATGRSCSRIALLSALLGHLERLYMELQEQGSAALVEEWIRHSSYARGKRVRVDQGQGRKIEGTTAGLTESGSLLVKQQDGHVVEVLAGDVAHW